MKFSRRSLLTGAIASIFAPAVVNAGILMPVKEIVNPNIMWYKGYSPITAGIFYCPYVPLQYAGTTKFEEKYDYIIFETRYGPVKRNLLTLEAKN